MSTEALDPGILILEPEHTWKTLLEYTFTMTISVDIGRLRTERFVPNKEGYYTFSASERSSEKSQNFAGLLSTFHTILPLHCLILLILLLLRGLRAGSDLPPNNGISQPITVPETSTPPKAKKHTDKRAEANARHAGSEGSESRQNLRSEEPSSSDDESGMPASVHLASRAAAVAFAEAAARNAAAGGEHIADEMPVDDDFLPGNTTLGAHEGDFAVRLANASVAGLTVITVHGVDQENLLADVSSTLSSAGLR